MKKILFILICIFFNLIYAQDTSLYQQFSGRIDFTMIGNTLNTIENEGSNTQCSILTSSSTSLNINNNNYIEAAYLYWAGSGTGDFQVTLNGNDLTADRTFFSSNYNNVFFSAFTDVTTQIRSIGNSVYTLSNLDLTNAISDHCYYGTNFGGWAIIIIYSNDNLPINQINVYDGMQRIPYDITIQLDNLYVIDNTDAKIGFLAWEGDRALDTNETIRINGNIVGNPPLNPYNNAFNGTNSFTGEENLYNMDLDYYSLENYVNIGDTSATIQLTSGQDYVMINSVVTKLNSQLPDATINLENYQITDCNERVITLNYSVSNTSNATSILPENTPVNFYAYNGIDNPYLLETIYTNQEIEINDAINLSIELNVPNNYNIIAIVDENNIIIEFDEANNEDTLQILYPNYPLVNKPENITECDTGYDRAIFDLEYNSSFINNDSNTVFLYYETLENLIQNENEIIIPNQYENNSNPQRIYIKVINNGCYSITSLDLLVENCPPIIPQLLPLNTNLEIDSLYNIFTEFEIIIFNRYGNIIYEGNNNSDKFNGEYKGKKLPSSTYFYTIYLNDKYYNVINGWFYLL